MTDDVLRSPETGALVIRGGAVRAVGYGARVLIGAGTSVLLLRHLGVIDFGRYATVMALLGIVTGVTDAGLTAVGARELAVRSTVERTQLLRNLVALRLIITPLGVAVAALFGLVAGYPSTLVYGVLIGGAGIVLLNTQATMMLPLSVELRIGTVTGFEVAKQLLTLMGVGALVAAGAALLPFFAVQIAVGAVVLVATPLVIGKQAGLTPGLDRSSITMLVRETLPMAAALTMNVIYFRVLVILTSLLGTATATGLFGTSFRIFEVLFGLPLLVLSVALPVLSVADEGEEGRQAHALQRMTEVALAASIVLTLVLVTVAEPVIVLLGGEEFRGAGSVLQIQAPALIPVFVGQVWQLGLVSARRQSYLAAANAIALAAVMALGIGLIPAHGATGAAIAAVIAETGFAGVLLWLLHRARPGLTPGPGRIPRIVLAGALGTAGLAIPGLSPVPKAAVVAVVYAGAILALRAVPAELLRAFRRRS